LSGCRTRRVSPAVAGRHLLVDARLKPQANLTGACVAFLLAARNQGTKPAPAGSGPDLGSPPRTITKEDLAKPVPIVETLVLRVKLKIRCV
jgi:hypothetical protein